MIHAARDLPCGRRVIEWGMKKSEIKALEAVEAGKVWDEEKEEEWVLHSSGIHARTIFELEDLGLISRKRMGMIRKSVEWRYSLTEAGKKALEEERE